MQETAGRNSLPVAELLKVPLRELTKEEIQGIARRAWHDPVFFCRYFLNDLFPQEMPWVHRGILAILTRKTEFLKAYGQLDKIVENFVYKRDEKDHQIFHLTQDGRVLMDLQRFTLIMLPRGFSKTTLAGVAFNVYNIVFAELDFAAYVSETARHAEMQMDNVKAQLEANEKIKFFFGDLRPKAQDSARWRQDFFETTTGMAMVARGRGGQVRGLNHKGKRPRIILVDDVEDRESVQTPELREKTRKWAYSDLQPALPALDSSASMLALGTLLHPDALMMTWARDPQWTVVIFGSYDRAGELLWPENMDEEKLKREERSAIASNTLMEYYMERHSVIRTDKLTDFPLEKFAWQAPPIIGQWVRALYQDPAIGKKEKADFCTFTVVEMREGGNFYVLESYGQRGMEPRQQIDKMFELHKAYSPRFTGIESNGYQAALQYIMKEEMFRKGYYFEITPVTNVIAKHARIKGITQPRFAAGAIFFTRKFIELEKEMIEFPFSSHDDHLDGLTGALSLLDPAAFLAQSSGEEKMEPLDEMIGGNWRHAV